MTRATFSVILLLVLPMPSEAETSLDVEIGWDGLYRAGRCGPVFVTISDTQPRAVLLEIHSPQENRDDTIIRRRVAASPTPATYAIDVRMPASAADVLVVARDALTERRLAVWPDTQQRMELLLRGAAADSLVGIVGRKTRLHALAAALPLRQIASVNLPLERLPTSPVGYDAFDLLMLNQPDLNRITAEQQRAIVEWVRGGGGLIFAPSEDAVPQDGPLIQSLPCEIAENIAVVFERGRIEHLKGRALSPKEGAQRIDLPGALAHPAWYHDVGSGRITVLPFDPTSLLFADDQAMQGWWKPLLDQSVKPALTWRAMPSDTIMTATAEAQRTSTWLARAGVLLILVLVAALVDGVMLKAEVRRQRAE